MDKKIARFSYNQLKVLLVFLQSANQVVTISQLQRKTGLKGKPLGALLSSLSRTKIRQQNLIYPAGKDQTSTGLRWLLNLKLLNLKQTKTQVHQLLKTYA